MTFALIFAFPPVGSANSKPQTKHLTLELALLNIVCSFLHLGQITFKNLLFGLGITFSITSSFLIQIF